MHQRVQVAGDEAVVDEDVLFDVERGVSSIQVACFVAGDAMAKREVLCAGWRTDRIRLDEPESLESVFQRPGREQAARDGKFAESIQRHTDLQDSNSV
jgi:hypothetical protein